MNAFFVPLPQKSTNKAAGRSRANIMYVYCACEKLTIIIVCSIFARIFGGPGDPGDLAVQLLHYPLPCQE